MKGSDSKKLRHSEGVQRLCEFCQEIGGGAYTTNLPGYRLIFVRATHKLKRIEAFAAPASGKLPEEGRYAAGNARILRWGGHCLAVLAVANEHLGFSDLKMSMQQRNANLLLQPVLANDAAQRFDRLAMFLKPVSGERKVIQGNKHSRVVR